MDLLPPTPRDPQGIHAASWDDIAGQPFAPPEGKPLTLAAYESTLGVRAYIEPVGLGDELPKMPLFLEPNGYVLVPLETTYRRAFAVLPRRWRAVLESTPETR